MWPLSAIHASEWRQDLACRSPGRRIKFVEKKVVLGAPLSSLACAARLVGATMSGLPGRPTISLDTSGRKAGVVVVVQATDCANSD